MAKFENLVLSVSSPDAKLPATINVSITASQYKLQPLRFASVAVVVVLMLFVFCSLSFVSLPCDSNYLLIPRYFSQNAPFFVCSLSVDIRTAQRGGLRVWFCVFACVFCV